LVSFMVITARVVSSPIYMGRKININKN
jgi:hypothetical protein